jgi:hypothetical protein
VKDERGEIVFMVRMWRQRIEENGSSEWRGSVHQVDSGTHVYIAGASEVADFIKARLAGESRPVR